MDEPSQFVGKETADSPKRWRLTIFPKLVIALVIVVAPLYGIAMLMNQLGQSRLEEELSNSLQLKVDFFMNSLVIEHEHMVDLLQEYMFDKDIQHLTYLKETLTLAEFTDTIRRIQHKLEQLNGSSIYAKRVSAHILTLNRSMNSETSISDELNEDFEAVEELSRNNGSGIFYWQGRMFLAISYPSLSSITIEPGFILSIEIDLNALRRGLSSFHDYDRSGAVLFHMENPLKLGSNESESIHAKLREFVKNQYRAEVYAGSQQMEIDNEPYVVAYRYSPILNYYLTAYIPTDQLLGSIDTYSNLLWLLSLIALIIIFVYSYWLYRLIHRPLQNLIKAFRRVDKGQLSRVELSRQNDEFNYLFQRFNVMVSNLNELIHQVYEQRLRAQSSELKQLQAQINPHFLYNTYFVLYRLAKMNDNESIARFCQYLGSYFQYITRNASDDSTLEMEFKHSRTYADIQNIRFKDRIHVDFSELDDAYRSYRIPRLILQPIVENAYKYGLETMRKDGRIRVNVMTTQEHLVITVEDNGQNLTDERIDDIRQKLTLQSREMEYTGLLNVQRRIQIRYGQQYGVFVSRADLGGLKVELRLPLHSDRIESGGE